MIYTIDILIEKIMSIGNNRYDLDKITRAYELAQSAHSGQLRSSGEPYISHPIAVAYLLLEFFMDTDTIAAALLHDVVEDTEISLEFVKKKFGADVALLVDGVTKIGLVPLNTKEEQHAENIRKILIAMSKDIRVIIIKLADRLHNMRTLDFRPSDKQRSTSLETMSFYAPIAHRLGMSSVKEEMEDLALRYLDPYGFKAIEEQLSLRKEQRENFIGLIKERIEDRLGDFSPPPVIEGRVKSIYSLYKKIYIAGKNFDEVYDIYGVRIIVQSVIECYNALGIIHDLFRPIPYRFKDYISTPKPNRYQSLHTTVIGREGIPFEVQIRTLDMHNTAQYGVAAHWKYKVGLGGQVNGEKRFDWIRHILEQQQEADDVEQIADAIKIDLTPDDVYVFTPKGDVITLPVGSNVIDFAYSIHTQVGNKMTGAKVGGRMVSFDYELKTGEIVEIMTTNSANYGPNRNWLDIVKTNDAKTKIRAWFKRERREENIAEGRSVLQTEFNRNSIPMDEIFLKSVAERQRFDNTDDFLAAIGYGGIKLSRIMQRVKDDYLKYSREQTPELTDEEISETVSSEVARKQQKGVIVEGIDNCLVKFAQCCTPLPGDEITGFITRGYGVSVHKADCDNVINLKKDPAKDERWLHVRWAPTEDIAYRATIDIIAEDRQGLIADITTAISGNRLPIIDINAHFLKNGNANVIVTIEVVGVEQFNNIMVKIKKIQGVINAERSGKL